MISSKLITKLNSKQLQVLTMTARNIRSKEIADRLQISLPAVAKQRQKIGIRTGANSLVLQVHLAIAAGLVENAYKDES